MMAQFTPFIALVAALLINTLSYCSAENMYCVTSTVTSCSSCPHNSANCTTLSEYARESELYFTSNTTMVFLPGDHTLDTNITVVNVTRLTMHGASFSRNRATVVCSGSVGLSFTSIVDLKMYSLAFSSCSRKYAFTLHSIPRGIVHVALLLHSTQYAELVNCSFHENIGTALVVNNTNITLTGNTEFARNRCAGIILGSAIRASGSNLTFIGNTTFLDNNAFSGGEMCQFIGSVGGGTIHASDNTMLSFCGTNNFINNSAHHSLGGAISASENIVLSFSGTNNFIGNSAVDGGGIYANGNTVLSFNGASNFIGNSAAGDGGAIIAYDNTSLSFNGASNFINNLAHNGGAISTTDTVLNFNGTTNFIKNSASWGGAIYTSINNTLTFNGTIYFTSNGYHGRRGITVDGYTFGGGVYIGLKSTFSILPNTTVYWENNHARLGGAIYVYDVSPASYCPDAYELRQECFFQLPGQNLFNSINVQLVFKNNSADAAGSVLYGGAIDNCKLIGLDSHNSGEVFDKIVYNNDTDYYTTSNISSDPLRICTCEHCNTFLEISRRLYPGEAFQVSVVAVGQRDGTVPSRVRRINHGLTLPDSRHLHQLNNTCTKLNYTAHGDGYNMAIVLIAEGSPCPILGNINALYIFASLYQTCPPGFNISESEQSCICEPRLAHYTKNCTITNGVGNITREAGQQFWVGYDDNQSQSDKLILHPLCPYSYCVNHHVSFPLNESDIQCANNRSGLFCGACKEGYSLVLATSRCRKCSNEYHLALLILFAVMGIALVFLLFVCKLTVATGTLSGLVFYANIVGTNRTTFLPVEYTDGFSLFVAWLNLDFGIETCFYNGLDAYSKTWLQFVFPIYIWVLVGFMILVSHFSRRFAKLLGNNPVSVLATLILFSYTKILRTLIDVFYITYLEYPTYNRMVWLYDANIDYLGGKHLPLFLVAVLVFLFLFLPYTLLLLFGQWLQAISHLRLFSWVNSARLKPFMDSYHAPYKAKHRYWPGLLLVLRCVLLLVFALNLQQDPSVNLLAIFVGTGILVVWAWVSGGVYKNWCLNALEGSFALNLIILAASTLYTMYTSCSERFQLVKGNQLAVGHTSVSIVLATFIGILGFQLANVTGITQYLKRKCAGVAIRNQAEAEVEPLDDFLPDRLINPVGYEPPFHTPQRHDPAEPTEANEAQRRLITLLYTYGSIN